jgi:hypothetical protein
MCSTILSAKQRRAARYLGLYMTQGDVARRVVVNPRTIRRWLTDIPEFAALVQAEKDASNDLRADDVLHDLLLSTDERVRLAAATQLRRTARGVVPAIDPDEDLGSGW